MAEDESAKAGKTSPKKEESVEKPIQPHYAGHRERLRGKFRKGGHEALHDYELLELILFRSLPRRDVKPLAKSLIQRFGSFAEAIRASPESLMEIEGINRNAATDMNLVHAAVVEISKYRAKNSKTVIDTWGKALELCHARRKREKREFIMILCLDKKNRLLKEEIYEAEKIDDSALNPGDIVKLGLDASSSAIILVQNRLSGDPEPSKNDKRKTEEIVEIAASVRIDLHDHVIIAGERHFSFRGNNLI